MSEAKQTCVIDGVEYDITDFMQRHPGGSDMLMLAVGRDASVMFHSYHRFGQAASLTVAERLSVP